MNRLKRLWGIRHLRAIYLHMVVHERAEQLSRFGIGIGVPNQSDLDFIDKVRRGEA